MTLTHLTVFKCSICSIDLSNSIRRGRCCIQTVAVIMRCCCFRAYDESAGVILFANTEYCGRRVIRIERFTNCIRYCNTQLCCAYTFRKKIGCV